jgi:NADPH:quinone reductase-like Zn-dependent oxidoreductase
LALETARKLAPILAVSHPTHMRAFEIQQFGLDNLALVDRPTPDPGPYEARVRLTAASLNYRDLMMVEGHYNPKLAFPLIPLSDGAGVVEAVGPSVTRVKPGDRVAGVFMQTWIDGEPDREKGASALGGSIDGVLSEYRVFHEDGLVNVPAHLSDVEAAALPCAGVTAWHALFEGQPAKPGDTVLIQGTGGVAIFALQFAKAAGLRPIVISSSDRKLERARELGAVDGINYRKQPDWEKEIAKLVPGGVDYVIEVGGAQTVPHSLKAVRIGGMIALIGILSGVEASISPVSILMQSVRMQGIYVGSRAMFERMNRAMELHKIKPVVDRVFPWLEVKDALKYMQQQSHFGKICLKF